MFLVKPAHNSSGENSRRKVQNVVADSTASGFAGIDAQSRWIRVHVHVAFATVPGFTAPQAGEAAKGDV
jgi:hypothetical protein